MNVPANDPGAVDQGDELARQRLKRAARSGEPGLPERHEAEVRALSDRCLGAIEESGGTFDVRAYLVDHGHSRQTIQAVLDRLRMADHRHPSNLLPLRSV